MGLFYLLHNFFKICSIAYFADSWFNVFSFTFGAKMTEKLFVFDLDDTLIDNVHDYAQPILDATSLIVEELRSKAPHVTRIINLEQEIDSRRVKEINPQTGKPFLFSMDRFPGSLVEVYRYICKQAKINPKAQTEERLFAIGLKAFDEQRYGSNIILGAKTIVDFLRNQGDVVVLLTKGDKSVQRKKIMALGSAHINFDNICVVETKNFKHFQQMTNFCFPPCQKWFSVGNSYESDIAPALEVGYKGILIPVETWEVIGKMEEILAKVDREKCFVFGDLFEITEKYEML
ncbi:MAG TPA: hypothetical protein VJH05_01570 [Candidatus Paceibacterota bacterium]